MPKRVLDFDAMWGSDKLAACASWAQAEYAWMYGLADASGCFEVTNLRVIWGRVAAIRSSLTLERLEQIFAEFADKGLLFVWEHEGKRYAHWTGSDVPGRLPPPSWRMRLERFTPPVPKQQLAAYMAKFARGRAAFGAAGFRVAAAHAGAAGGGSDLHEPAEGRVAASGDAQNAQASWAMRVSPEERARCRQENFKFEISDLNCAREYATGPARDGGSVGAAAEDAVLRSRSREALAAEGRGKPAESVRAHETVTGGKCAEAAEEIHRGTGKGGLEEAQGQDLDLNLNPDSELGVNSGLDLSPASNSIVNADLTLDLQQYSDRGEASISRWDEIVRWSERQRSAGRGNVNASETGPGSEVNSGCRSSSSFPDRSSSSPADATKDASVIGAARARKVRDVRDIQLDFSVPRQPFSNVDFRGMSAREIAVAKELRVGMGPHVDPSYVNPKALERIRRREAARAKTRSP